MSIVSSPAPKFATILFTFSNWLKLMIPVVTLNCADVSVTV